MRKLQLRRPNLQPQARLGTTDVLLEESYGYLWMNGTRIAGRRVCVTRPVRERTAAIDMHEPTSIMVLDRVS